jgi:23S rRNA pseudouridine2605 synthase/23S rRNA pseudouridine2604 synthase
MGLIRLQKWLSEAGVCSRRQGENFIRAGRVGVNGRVVTVLGTKIDPQTDAVTVDGRPVAAPDGKIYIALHKPAGYVTSCRHPGERLVIDLVGATQRIFPVGRLDKDSTGLLLLTNDGPLHHYLSHPSFNHEKEYEVMVDGPIAGPALSYMAKGMPLQGSRTRPAKVTRLSETRFRIVLKEGRNRQIRRMVRKVGRRVVALKRIRIAHIVLGDLAEGHWRPLTADEIQKLIQPLAGKDRAL